MNRIIITGNLCADPERRETTSGIPCVNFRVGVRRDYKNAQGEYETDFLQCSTFRASAEYLAKYAHKGDKLAVEGKLHTRNYKAQDGSQRTLCEIVADNIEIMRGGEKRAQQGTQDGFEEVQDDGLPF